MGCRCCRMIKSYIYDPTVAGDGRKSDSAGSSLYQPHHLSGGGDTLGPDPLGGHNKQKQGFHNLGYSKSNDGTLKLEADNNHVNRLHGGGGGPERELARQGSAPCPDPGRLYIIQPETPGPRWATPDRGPSQVPVYPSMQDYSTPSPYDHTDSRKSHYGDGGGHRATTGNGWDASIGDRCGTRSESLSADEGVGGTPDPCDTGDEGSVRSVDIHTSTTSVSSDERGPPKTPDNGTMESGICVMKSEEEEEEECDDAESVTDSMVAEALAALEAATAGEDDYECD